MGAMRSGQGQPAMRNPAWVSGTARIPQELLNGVGHRPRVALKRHYTKKWLDGTLGEFVLAVSGRGRHTD